MAIDTREIYVTALKNTHALEMQALQIMERQVERLTRYPEMEEALRRHIEDVCPINSVHLDNALIAAFGLTKDQRRAGRPSREYNELSLWDHVLLILTDSNWSHFETALKPKAMFRKLLEPVRDARNQMAHFRGELTAVQLDALKQARYWLENRQVVSALQINAPVVVDVTTINGAVSVTEEGDIVTETASSGAPTSLNGALDRADIPHTSDSSSTPPIDHDAGSDEQARVEQSPVTEGHFGDRERRLEKKYTPLEQWLRDQADEQTHIRVDFRLIEEIIGEPLPPSARQHSNWWANVNVGRSQSTAWLSAGWRVESVDLDDGKVVFRRANSVRMQEFFRGVLDRFKQIRPEATRASKTQPQNWFNFGAGKTGFAYGWAFSYEGLRVELYIDTTDYDTNKWYFGILEQHKESIEEKIGQRLDWRRLEHRRASRVFIERPGKITDSQEQLEEYKEWAVDTMVKFVDAFQPVISQLESPPPA